MIELVVAFTVSDFVAEVEVVGSRSRSPVKHAVAAIAPQLDGDAIHERLSSVDDAVVVGDRCGGWVGIGLVVPHQVADPQLGPETKVHREV